MWEKYFVALPQLYGWFYLQKFAGMEQWCTLQEDDFSSTDTMSQECFEYAFLFKTFYLFIMSSGLIAQPVLWSLWYNRSKAKWEENDTWKNKSEEKDGDSKMAWYFPN